VTFPLNWEDDDRLERWMTVNGVATIDAFGGDRVRYFRADGSEVIPATSYGYDAVLTPYTNVVGSA